MLTRQADCFPEGVDQQMTRTQYKFHTVSIMAKHHKVAISCSLLSSNVYAHVCVIYMQQYVVTCMK